MNHVKLPPPGQVESADRRRALLSLPEVAKLFARGALQLLGAPVSGATSQHHSQLSATTTESSLDLYAQQSGTGNRLNNQGIPQ